MWNFIDPTWTATIHAVLHPCGYTVIALADNTTITILFYYEAPELRFGASSKNFGARYTSFKPLDIPSSNHTFYSWFYV
jgi:hypothetical protein